MVTRSKTKKAKANTRKQTKAKAGKVEVRPDGLRKDSAAARLVDAICSAKGATHGAQAPRLRGKRVLGRFLAAPRPGSGPVEARSQGWRDKDRSNRSFHTETATDGRPPCR